MPSDKTPMPDALEQAQAAPWNTSFLALLRHLSCRHPALPPVGYARRPQEEPFRLGQRPSLAFAPAEIASVSEDAVPHIDLFSLGMLGPNGVLPIHLTELAKDRMDNHRDDSLKDFFDIFHHRAMVQFYRAWADAQATTGMDRADDAPFTRHVAQLCGLPHHTTDTSLPLHAQLALAPFLFRMAHDPDALASAIRHYFILPVMLEEYILHWLSIAQDDQACLGQKRPACTLGHALLGQRVADRHLKFRLHIGPMPLAQYLRFLADGSALPALLAIVASLAPSELMWDMVLLIDPHTIPAPVLGSPLQLARTAWIGHVATDIPTPGSTFSPYT